MLKRLWQWLVRLFRRLIVVGRKPQLLELTSEVACLSDMGYELLFMRLLDRVEEGWSEPELLARLGERTGDHCFKSWLQRFGNRLLSSPVPNHQLGARLIRLGRIGCGEIGKTAQELGKQLLQRELELPEPAERPAPAEITAGVTEASTAIDTAVAWSQHGSQQFLEGDLPGAITSYDRALQLQPESHQAWNNRGYALADLGRYQEAITSYDKAIAIKPDSYKAWYNRGMALKNLGRSKEAITSYNNARDNLLTSPITNHEIEQRLVRLGKMSCGEIGEIAQELGEQLLQQEILELPEPAKIIEVTPTDSASTAVDTDSFNQGNQQSCNQPSEIISYDRALLPLNFYPASNHQSGTLVKLSQSKAAIVSYDDAGVEFDQHQACFKQGNKLKDSGRLEEAIASYDKAIALKPDKHQAWNNRGSVLKDLGRYEAAIASYDKAIAIKPDKHEAWYNRGLALQDLGHYEAAIASYDKAIAIKPDKHEAWNNRGVALQDLGHYEAAIASYDKAIAIKPDKHEAWNNRGVVLKDLGRLEEAIASYDKAIAINPDSCQVQNNRGLALQDLKRSQAAIAYDEVTVIAEEPEAWKNQVLALSRSNEAIAYDEVIAIAEKPEAWKNQVLVLKNLCSKEVIRSCDKAIETESKHPEAWNNRHRVPQDLGSAKPLAEVRISQKSVNRGPVAYEQVQHLKPEAFKRLCGVQPDIFCKMVEVLRQAKRQQRTSKPSKLSLEDQMLMSLQYWRGVPKGRSFFEISQSWQVDEFTVRQIIQEVENTLI